MSEEPNVLALINRSATERLQVSINSYKDKKYLDMRIYFTTDDGMNWNPTKKGVTVSPDHLVEFKDAVEAAIAELCPDSDAE